MPVIMDARPEKDFMNTKTSNSILRYFFIVLAIGLLIPLSSCDPQLIDDEIPFVDFEDQYLNLSLPEYQSLSFTGGYYYKNDIGVRGVILYRKSLSEVVAFERNCSFQPGDACATVEVHISTLFMQDYCCNSTFNFDGVPTGGPAWRNLRQYYTRLNGSTLTITSEVVN